jgi:hypothetical protein
LEEVKQTENHTPTKRWDGTALANGDPLHVRVRIGAGQRQKHESFRVQISEKTGAGGVTTVEGMKLTRLGIEYGVKAGLLRLQAAQTE